MREVVRGLAGGARPSRSPPLWLLLGALCGCSALVDPTDRGLPCERAAGAADPCAAIGLVCVVSDGIRGFCEDVLPAMDAGPPPDAWRPPAPDAGCVAPDGAVELCNGLDDDCDGVVDNGHDADGDGVTWCGGGLPAQVDCLDSNPAVHPAVPSMGIEAAPEICDGLDNDCDLMIDEPPDTGSLCPDAQTCFMGRCLAPDDCRLPSRGCGARETCDVTAEPARCRTTGCTRGSCTAPEVCNLESGDCVTPRPDGRECTSDAFCESEVCAPVGAFGPLPSPPAFGKMCTRSCCSDGDCSAGEICWSTGVGTKLCIPEAHLDRTRGPGGPGAACADGTECASGLCFETGSSGACLGNCARHADCSGGRCAVTVYDRPLQSSFAQLACLRAQGGGSAGASCWRHDQCRYGWCWVDTPLGVCGGPCRSDSDCPSDQYCGVSAVAPGGTRYAFRECRPNRHGGALGGGANCARNGQCRDFACVGGQCAGACCSDSQCAAGRLCKVRDMGSGLFATFCLPSVAG